MTNQMPLEGFEDHTHHHPHPPMDLAPLPYEAIASGAQTWLAREFVGGLIAMAQTHEVDVADFLAEKCMILAMRAANGEAEVEVLRGQVRALQQQVADCPCHEENAVQPYGDMGGSNADMRIVNPSAPDTSNGDTN